MTDGIEEGDRVRFRGFPFPNMIVESDLKKGDVCIVLEVIPGRNSRGQAVNYLRTNRHPAWVRDIGHPGQKVKAHVESLFEKIPPDEGAATGETMMDFIDRILGRVPEGVPA